MRANVIIGLISACLSGAARPRQKVPMIRRPLTMLCSIAASCAVLAAQGTGTPQTRRRRRRRTRKQPDVPYARRLGQRGRDRDRQAGQAGHRSQGRRTSRSGKPARSRRSRRFKLIQSRHRRDEPVGAERRAQILSMSDMARETANPENRLFIIFLDDYHTRAGNALHIRQELAQLVSELTSRDLVALLYPLNADRRRPRSRATTTAPPPAIMKFRAASTTTQPTNDVRADVRATCRRKQQEQIRNDLVDSRPCRARARCWRPCAKAARRCSS